MSKSSGGFERIQLIWILATAVLIGLIIVPVWIRRRESEKAIHIKAWLRNFHAASEVYRNRHPEQGYPETIAFLVQNAEKIPYLDDSWLKQGILGYRLAYERDKRARPSPRTTYALKVERESKVGPQRTFCIDQRGIIWTEESFRGKSTLEATPEGCRGGIEVV